MVKRAQSRGAGRLTLGWPAAHGGGAAQAQRSGGQHAGRCHHRRDFTVPNCAASRSRRRWSGRRNLFTANPDDVIIGQVLQGVMRGISI